MDIPALCRNSRLFLGIAPEDVSAMLQCLSAKEKAYKKGSFLFHAGEEQVLMGLLLSGRVHIIQEDFWGGRTILAEVVMGQVFGEAYACAKQPLEVSVEAVEDCSVLFLDVGKVLHVCTSACAFHTRLVQNLLTLLAEKNLLLTKKVEHMAKRTTREKLLSFLSSQAMRAESSVFTIPFNRQQLADYLAVERSAMSAELSKLRKDGWLDYQKNTFRLLKWEKEPLF